MRVRHEAIYQALYVERRGALRRELVTCLRTERALRVPRARTGRGKAFVSPEVMIAQRAEAFFAATGTSIRHAGTTAYYSSSQDVVVLPARELRRDEGARADAMDGAQQPPGTGSSARALATTPTRRRRLSELGASYLAVALGISCEPREDHAVLHRALAADIQGGQAGDSCRRHARAVNQPCRHGSQRRTLITRVEGL